MEISKITNTKEIGKKGIYNLDFDLEVYTGFGKLDGVNIYYCEKYVKGMDLKFGGLWTGIFKGEYSIDECNNIKHEFVDGDELNALLAFCDKKNNITGITLYTKLNKYTFGNLNEEQFQLSEPGRSIISLKIAFGKCLNFISPIYSEDIYETNGEDTKITKLYGTINDDSQEFKNEYESSFGKLKDIKIYSDDYVKGYSLVYENKTIQTCNIFPDSQSNKVKANILSLSTNEEIDKIYIRAGSIIDHLSFITNKGNVVSGGAVGGKGKLYERPTGYNFIGFEGGLLNNLHYLKLKFIKN
jgi:hypothetical protein